VGIGDWGLGIGQSPIPNPQSPNDYKLKLVNTIKINNIILLIELQKLYK